MTDGETNHEANADSHKCIALSLWRGGGRVSNKPPKPLLYRALGDFEFMGIAAAGDGSSFAEALGNMRKASINLVNAGTVPNPNMESAHNIYAFQRETDEMPGFFLSDNSDGCLLFVYMLNFKYSTEEPEHFLKRKADKSASSKSVAFTAKEFDQAGIVQQELDALKGTLPQDLRKEFGSQSDLAKTVRNESFAYYISISSCDAILFFKTNHYDLGHQVARLLENRPRLQYSYSLGSIRYPGSVADREKVLSCLSEAEETRTTDQVQTPKIALCHIIGDRTAFDAWHEQMRAWWDKTAKTEETENTSDFEYDRLGSEDHLLNISNRPFPVFARELLRENGLFYAKDDPSEPNAYRKGLIRPRLHLDYQLGAPVSHPPQSSESTKSYYGQAQDIFNRYLPNSPESEHLVRALRAALLSCDHLNRNGFAPELLDFLDHTFPLFLEKLEAALTPTKKLYRIKDKHYYTTGKHYYTNEIITDIHEYLDAIMGIVNGALQSERVFFQSPGFNTNLYDVPINILHFSQAFAHCLAQPLSRLDDSKYKDCQYRFILHPTMTPEMSVRQLFFWRKNHYGRKSVAPKKTQDTLQTYQEKPLLRVHVPVYMFFEPQNLLLELTHEAAHVVGIASRKRKQRFDHQMKMGLAACLRQIMVELPGGSAKMLPGHGIDDWLTKVVIPHYTSWFKQWYRDKRGRYASPFVNLLVNGTDGTNGVPLELAEVSDVHFAGQYAEKFQHDLLTEYFSTVFPFLSKENAESSGSFLSAFSEARRKELAKTDDEIVAFLKSKVAFDSCVIRNTHHVLRNIPDIVSRVKTLSKESYADMVMMAALGLTAADYVRYISGKLCHAGGHLLYQDANGERIVSVLNVFNAGSDGREGNFAAADDTANSLWDDTIAKWWVERYEKNNLQWWDTEQTDRPCSDKFLNDLYRVFEPEPSDQRMTSLPPWSIWENVDYLRECLESWPKSDPAKPPFVELRKIYHRVKDGSSEAFFRCLALSDWFSGNLEDVCE
jgi:hypothetical protein